MIFELFKFIFNPKFIFYMGIASSIALFVSGLAKNSKGKMTAAAGVLLLVACWAWKGGSVGFGTGKGTGAGDGSGHGLGGTSAVGPGLPEPEMPLPGNPQRAPSVVIAPPEMGERNPEIENLSAQLDETRSTLKQLQTEHEALLARHEQLRTLLSRFGAAPRPATLFLRYTETGDPEFSAQIFPAVQIKGGTGGDFNEELQGAFESLADSPQFKFGRLCILNAEEPGSSQIDAVDSAARQCFPGITVEKIYKK